MRDCFRSLKISSKGAPLPEDGSASQDVGVASKVSDAYKGNPPRTEDGSASRSAGGVPAKAETQTSAIQTAVNPFTMQPVIPEEPTLHPPLELASKRAAESRAKNTWASESFRKTAMTAGQRAWMDKLKKDDLSGVMPRLSQFLQLTGKELTSNPRSSPEYAEKCLVEAELGAHFSEKRYEHIKSQADKDLLAWAIKRDAGCIWLEGSERTYVRAVKHRLVTRGPPVRQGMHRLSRPDMEWVEKAVAEDVNGGQLIKGSSEWGFPALPTKEAAAHKAIKRKRRVVVDYRALNRVTVRKVFFIPNSDQINRCVAGSQFISVGDAKEGFNQVENEPESAKKIAVLVASGTCPEA